MNVNHVCKQHKHLSWKNVKKWVRNILLLVSRHMLHRAANSHELFAMILCNVPFRHLTRRSEPIQTHSTQKVSRLISNWNLNSHGIEKGSLVSSAAFYCIFETVTKIWIKSLSQKALKAIQNMLFHFKLKKRYFLQMRSQGQSHMYSQHRKQKQVRRHSNVWCYFPAQICWVRKGLKIAVIFLETARF